MATFQKTYMVVLLCIIIVLESIESIIRTNYTMTFAKYGKSGTAAGILNGAMSASFVIASYVIPLLIENFGWRTVIFVWSGILLLSTVLVLIASVKQKTLKISKLLFKNKKKKVI